MSEPDRRRFLGRLVREVSRAELMASEHAAHAESMRARFSTMVSGYELPTVRGGLGAALATLRDLVVDRIVQAERAYRIALLDLRQGLDVVKLLRETARGDELLGIMRWCDDWLSARRTLVAHAERELAWFSAIPAHTTDAERTELAPNSAETRGGAPTTSDDRPTSRDGR